MIKAILLAAGSSSRFGKDKLCEALADGRGVLATSLDNLCRGQPGPIVVVAPHNASLYAPVVQQLKATLVVCPEAHQGIGHSLACGVRASAEAEGWVVALADMPFIASATIVKLADTLRAGASIVVPVYHKQRGHPVGFAQRWRDQLLACHGDRGAAWILKSHPELVVELPCADPGVCRDIDSPNDLPAPPADTV